MRGFTLLACSVVTGGPSSSRPSTVIVRITLRAQTPAVTAAVGVTIAHRFRAHPAIADAAEKTHGFR